jgi:hypothetical protein
MVRRRDIALDIEAQIMSIMLRIHDLRYFAWVRYQHFLPPSVRASLRRGERVIAEADSEIHPQFPPVTYFLIIPPEEEHYLPMRWVVRVLTADGGDTILQGYNEEVDREVEEAIGEGPEGDGELPERIIEAPEKDDGSERNA